MDFIDDLKARRLFHQCSDEEGLRRRFAAGPVTGYIGFDPTAASLHVGHLLQVMLLVRLQRAGHRPIAVVGGGTGLIGDPSGKATERTMLTREQLDANLAGLRGQLDRYLDFSGADGAVMVDNATWLGALNLVEFLRDVGKHFSINAMVQRDSVRTRLEQREHGISYTEFSYMLLQAYDFLALNDHYGCELQMGGSDQWGNIVSGIDLIRRSRGREGFALTTTLITRADGQKFGKSEQGTVWLDPSLTTPYEFFQFWLNTDDADVERYLLALTFAAPDAIAGAMADHARDPGRRVPHRLLAEEVTRFVHGLEGLERARVTTEVLFGGGDWSQLRPDELAGAFRSAPSSALPRAALGTSDAGLVKLLVEAGLFKSNSEARTAVTKSGASINGQVCVDARKTLGHEDLLAGGFVVLRKGKKTYHLVRVTD